MKKSAIITTIIIVLIATGVYLWSTRTIEWKTYKSETIGITFKYPDSLTIENKYETENGSLRFCYDCDTPGEDIEIARYQNRKNLSAKEFAEQGIIYNSKNTGVKESKISNKEAWTLMSTSNEGDLEFEIIFTKLENNKILEFGIGFESKEDQIYKDFQKMAKTIEFL